MSIIIGWGLYAVGCAGISTLLEKANQKGINEVFDLMVKLSLIGGVGYEVHRHAQMIISDFGGLPA